MLILTALLLVAVIIFLSKKFALQAKKYYKSYFTGLFWTTCVLLLIAIMVIFPKTAFDGAVSGLKIWWNIVFPSLLPFFIASEMLMNLGLVHFMGVLLEPVMRPLFNVPGTGSFVLVVGYTSGFPVGAMVTAKLREQKMCSKIEAERLVSYTNNSSPLFMLVAVAVGMFNNPALGPIIAGAHYLSNLTLGLFLRFYGQNDREIILKPLSHGNIFRQAFREMLRVQQQEKRPFGMIINDAVKNSVNNLLKIGGFIILFAVIIRLLTAAGIIDLLAHLTGLILLPLGLSPTLLPALSSGFFEMTIGTKMASEALASPFQQLMIVGMILGWGGLSVHTQVSSMIAHTDISLFPFILTRFAHAFLAAFYTFLLYGPARPVANTLVYPVLATLPEHQATSMWLNLPLYGYLSLLTIIFTITSVLLLYLLQTLCLKIWQFNHY